MRQALIHLDFRMAEQVGHSQRVAHTLLDEHVAIGTGDADQLNFRASQGIRNGKCVINAGIKIKNHLFHVCAFLFGKPDDGPPPYGCVVSYTSSAFSIVLCVDKIYDKAFYQ